MKISDSDKKVLRVIEYNENYIKNAEAKGMEETYKKHGGFLGFTTLFYDKINLKHYKEMLGKDKRKLPKHLKELYQAI